MRRLTLSRTPQLSQLYDQGSFFGKFQSDIRACRQELLIESAFITHKRVRALLPILATLVSRGVNVTINTRYPDEHDGFMREQALLGVTELQAVGITVLYTAGLHRKVALLDRTIVWEGSLNILSQSDSCELMRRTNSAGEAERLLRYVGLKSFL
jgi:hypothetical protein